MAGSRLEKIGSIFEKVTGLIKSNAIKDVDKPLWYNVYKAFPPKYEPRYDRPVPTKEIPNIFYPEDIVRAFVEKYVELQQNDDHADEATLFQATIDKLAAEGLVLSRPVKTQLKVDMNPVVKDDASRLQPSDNSSESEKTT